MEVKLPIQETYNGVDATTSIGKVGNHGRRFYKETQKEEGEEEENIYGNFDLRSLSKVLIPPLGASSNNPQNQIECKGTIISPMNSKYRCWQTLMVGMVAYSAWIYPFEVAFIKSSPKSQLYIVDTIVDFFFAIDIILTFFVAYIDHTTHLLVRDPKKIATRYLSTWFVMDVASTIPFELISHLFAGKHRVSLSYAVLGVLRFWRLRRVKQFFTRFNLHRLSTKDSSLRSRPHRHHSTIFHYLFSLFRVVLDSRNGWNSQGRRDSHSLTLAKFSKLLRVSVGRRSNQPRVFVSEVSPTLFYLSGSTRKAIFSSVNSRLDVLFFKPPIFRL